MPAKIDAEANLRFLYVCFKHSNFSTIDYHKVAAHFQIKAPAARMRLMRLRMALEGESTKDNRGKRNKEDKGGKGKAYVFYDDEDDDEALDNLPLADRMKLRLLRIKREESVKREEGWEGGIKREFDWESVKKEEEHEDEKGRVKLEPFGGGVATFKTEDDGVEDYASRRPFDVKMEQRDIKTESNTGCFAYPAPFTFAPTNQPTFFNPFSQMKPEPELDTSLPGYHNQSHPQTETSGPSITTTGFSPPQTNKPIAIPTSHATPIQQNTRHRTDSPMLGTDSPMLGTDSSILTTQAPHNLLTTTPSSPTTPLNPNHSPTSPTHMVTDLDTPMLGNEDLAKRDGSSVPLPSGHVTSAAANGLVENGDGMETTDGDIMRDIGIATSVDALVGEENDVKDDGGSVEGLTSPLVGVKLQRSF